MERLRTMDEVRAVLNEFNAKYPRPNHAPLEVTVRYDLVEIDPTAYYPASTSPGVYLITNGDDHLLYIGKASCNANIGSRLGAHFKSNGAGGSVCHRGWEGFRYVRAIPLDPDRAFEAPAVEEYLIRHLPTPYNVAGKSAD